MATSETAEPTNADIMASVDQLRADLNGRISKLETWRVDHEALAATRQADLLALAQRLERQNTDIITQVSGTVKAMFQDGLRSWAAEEFVDLFRQTQTAEEKRLADEQTAREKKEEDERRAEVRRRLAGIERSIRYIVPVSILISTVLSIVLALGQLGWL